MLVLPGDVLAVKLANFLPLHHVSEALPPPGTSQ